MQPTLSAALALPPVIKSPEGLNAILGFLAGAFADTKKPGQTKTIRFVDDEAGKRWWQLSDACDALEVKNPSDAKKRLPKAFLTTLDSTEGGPPRNFIDISGVSQLILESRKPEAQPYKAFINGAVVPELYATGSYQGKGLEELAQNPAIAQAVFDAKEGQGALPAGPQLSPLAIAYETTKEAKRLAASLGLTGLEKREFILNAVCAHGGIDLRALMPATEPEACPVNHQHQATNPNEICITATELGKRLDPVQSGRSVNQVLAAAGYIMKTPEGVNPWDLTELGRANGGLVVLQTGASTPGTYQNIKWAPSRVLPLLVAGFAQLDALAAA